MLVTGLNLLVYIAAESPFAARRSWPVLLSGVIGSVNAWWQPRPSGEIRRAKEDIIEALRAELKIRDETAGARYRGPAVGLPEQPPKLPRGRGLPM